MPKRTPARKVKSKPTKKSSSKSKSAEDFFYSLNARPDTVDFRDLMFVPTLSEVPPEISLEEYKQRCGNDVLILDQGKDGACTGYALANVANFLLRSRMKMPDKESVSPKMLYRFARRYDEWPGEKYSGSSARGAIKAWHKHGVCSNKLDEFWEKMRFEGGEDNNYMNLIDDARSRPLGAYFRVNHKDLVAMHSAMAEVGILYATAKVHENWRTPVRQVKGKDKRGNILHEHIIEFDPNNFTLIGAHAFSIVAYDRDGFWIQNSWGEKWGDKGFAKVSYDEWLLNGTDVWVARLGVPVNLKSGDAKSSAYSVSKNVKNESSFYQFRSHLISIGNDGHLKQEGTYGHGKNSLTHIINGMDVTINSSEKKWNKRRILLYAHGGLVPEESILQRLSDYRETLLSNEIFPVFFMWHSDFWSTVKNILSDALNKRKTKDVLGGIRDFMMDRADDLFEYLVREPGKLLWDEMKENAMSATLDSDGGANIYLTSLLEKIKSDKKNDYEINLIGHSAGSIFLGPVIEFLTKRNITINSCTLWAPACTIDHFMHYYEPAISSGKLKDFNLYTLTDTGEQNDNCASIYNKSLLYLVSNSFEETPRVPVTLPYGTPLLGMEKFINPEFWEAKELAKINNEEMRMQFEKCSHNAIMLKALFEKHNVDWIKSPNDFELCNSQTHSGFDDDKNCLESSIASVLNKSVTAKSFSKKSGAEISIRPSKISIDERVEFLNQK